MAWILISFVYLLQSRKKRTRSGIRIDRSMIGLPTDFQHTIHIGSNDIELNNTAVRALQNQMQSKGGYETSYTALKVLNTVNRVCYIIIIMYVTHKSS